MGAARNGRKEAARNEGTEAATDERMDAVETEYSCGPEVTHSLPPPAVPSAKTNPHVDSKSHSSTAQVRAEPPITRARTQALQGKLNAYFHRALTLPSEENTVSFSTEETRAAGNLFVVDSKAFCDPSH
ncbi:PREDICTED: uncharacterized protein LOC104806060 [Tarenaya hassleriana]|uniref:uncharacterized protein LOC104806060 n=1 Tax=Tarenaya hassleriana TaxID=28532 RepID=UPI00053C0A89|nr:PREDICTED: uncharacterized protein LOC104806060 [Tarenaya hassleriana]